MKQLKVPSFTLSTSARRWLLFVLALAGIAFGVWKTVPFHMPPVLTLEDPAIPYSIPSDPVLIAQDTLQLTTSTTIDQIPSFEGSERVVSIVVKLNDEIAYETYIARGDLSLSGLPRNLPHLFELSFPRTGLHTVEIYVVDKVAGWFELKSNVVKLYLGVQKSPPTSPIITGILPTSQKGKYIIAGFADPYSQIAVSGLQVGEYERFRANQWGQFLIMGTPREDAAELSLIAFNHHGESATAEAIPLNELSSYLAPAQPIVETYLSLKVTPDIFEQAYKLDIPVNSPGISELLSQRTGLGNYLLFFSGKYTINGSERLSNFQRQMPNVTIAGERAQIEISERSYYYGDLNPFGDSTIVVEFAQGFPLPGNHGDFTLMVENLRIKSISPRPDAIDGSKYVWNHIPAGQKITLVVTNRSVNSFWASINTLSLYDLGGRNFLLSTVLYLLLRLVIALPLVFSFWLLEKIKDPEVRQQFRPAQSLLQLGMSLITISLLWDLVESLVTYGIYRAPWYPVFSQWIYATPELSYIEFMGGGSFQNYIFDIGATAFLFLLFGLVRLISLWARIPVANTVFGSLQKPLVYIAMLITLGFSVEFLTWNIDNRQFSFWFTWIVGTVTTHTVIMTFVMEIRYFLKRQASRHRHILLSFAIWGLAAVLAYETGSSLVSLSDPTFAIDFSVRIQRFFGIIGLVALPLSFFPAMMLASYFDYQSRAEGVKVELDKKINELKNYWSEHEKQILLAGLLFFAGYIIRTNDRWLLVPVSFLIAIPVFWKWVIASPETWLQLQFVENIVRSRRAQLLSLLAEDLALKRLQKQREDALVNLAGGKIAPADFDTTIEAIDRDIKGLKNPSPLPDGIPLRDVVLAFGPESTAFANAVIGMKWAFWFHLPFLFVFARFYLLDNLSVSQLYLLLDTVIELVSYSLRWLSIGFFLGYLFDFIRGNSGLRKSLYFSAGVVLSLLPYRLTQTTSAENFSAFVFEMGQIALFAILVGLALDWETLRRNGYGLSFLRLVTSDIPSLVSVSSVVVTTVGVVLSSILTGQLTQLLSTVVVSVLPTITSLPGLR